MRSQRVGRKRYARHSSKVFFWAAVELLLMTQRGRCPLRSPTAPCWRHRPLPATTELQKVKVRICQHFLEQVGEDTYEGGLLFIRNLPAVDQIAPNFVRAA